MTLTEAFGDVADILAKTNPSIIADLKAPKEINERVNLLISKKKDGSINNEETLELERFMALDMLINLAKARAKTLLAAWVFQKS